MYFLYLRYVQCLPFSHKRIYRIYPEVGAESVVEDFTLNLI